MDGQNVDNFPVLQPKEIGVVENKHSVLQSDPYHISTRNSC